MAQIDPGTSGTPTGNRYVDTLVWGGAWAATPGQGVTLRWSTVTTESLDDYPTPTPGLAWSATATDALRQALSLWSEVAALTFVEAMTGPDLSYLLVSDQVMRQRAGPGVLGFHEVPDGTFDAPLTGVFNAAGRGWTEAGLARGGYGFVTLVHEIGHALGLAHPHDGGGSGEVFPGVVRSSSLGTHALNQGIWTVMSYVDGWESAYPDHADNAYGWEAGPMAFDIAAIQAIYGANMTTRTGDDVYALPTANAPGTYWSCIWDAGGLDTLSAAAATADAVIDLRAASLAGASAGGFVSRIPGVVGGVTIAHGVVVENATGGAGNDRLLGNAAGNRLSGGAGADRINGGGGNDSIAGGEGADTLTGGAGLDSFVFDRVPADRGGVDRISDFTMGQDRILLDHPGFAGIGGPGPLAAGKFALGKRALDADDQLLYDATTGALRWDADGAGGTAAVVIANIGAAKALDATGFWIL